MNEINLCLVFFIDIWILQFIYNKDSDVNFPDRFMWAAET